MGKESMEDRPKIPAPRVDFKIEVEEYARRVGAHFIIPGAEFGPVYPLDQEVIDERAEAARKRLLSEGSDQLQEKAD